MTLNAHFDAFAARLNHGIIFNKVDDVVRLTGQGEPVRANYVVVGIEAPTPDDGRYTAAQRVDSSAMYRFGVRSVAVDRAGVLLFAQTVRERLLGHVLTVPGRVCGPVRLVGAVEEGRVRWDRTARLFYLDESFEFRSQRSTS